MNIYNLYIYIQKKIINCHCTIFCFAPDAIGTPVRAATSRFGVRKLTAIVHVDRMPNKAHPPAQGRHVCRTRAHTGRAQAQQPGQGTRKQVQGTRTNTTGKAHASRCRTERVCVSP